jgi:Family of unknown function (DUF6228)
MSASSHFVIGSSGGRTLAVSRLEQTGYSHDSYFTATVTAESLHASLSVYVHGPAGLVHFFEDLSASWQGWTGVKEWKSIEKELAISASHDRLGHVDLAVTLRPPLGPYGWDWEAKVHVPLEAGAQLEQTVIGLRTLFPGE